MVNNGSYADYAGNSDYSRAHPESRNVVLSNLETGADLVLTPPNGFCVDEGSSADKNGSYFAIFDDCLLVAGAGSDGGLGRSNFFSGVITVAIEPTPLYAPGDRTKAFNELEDWMHSDNGLLAMGISGQEGNVTLPMSRRTGSALYVMVVETDPKTNTAHRVWRAITQIGGHAAIVSLGLRRDASMENSEMLGALAQVVNGMHRKNGDAVSAEDQRLAEFAPYPFGSGGPSHWVGTLYAPGRSPVPSLRTASADHIHFASAAMDTSPPEPRP